MQAYFSSIAIVLCMNEYLCCVYIALDLIIYIHSCFQVPFNDNMYMIFFLPYEERKFVQIPGNILKCIVKEISDPFSCLPFALLSKYPCMYFFM